MKELSRKDSGLMALTTVELSEGAVSDAEVEALKKSRPGLEVRRLPLSAKTSAEVQ